MSNYSTGHKAEVYAEKYLKKMKFKIIALNFKTRRYEIDIIAQKNKCLHFVEIKYRQTADQGTGFDYITDNKLKQMKYAAEMWVSEHDWQGEYVLSAIEMTGDDYRVTNFIQTIV